MRTLAAADMIGIWERGLACDEAERALAILQSVTPEREPNDLALLPIGRRDILLLAAHRRVFGRLMEGVFACPACGEMLEFTLDAAEIERAMSCEPVEPGALLALTVDSIDISFRLPTSDDQLAAARCGRVDAAEALLVSRCIVDARRDGVVINPTALPPSVLAAVAEEMSRHDPAAIIDLDLTCPACERPCQAPLHIASFLWTKFSGAARGLIRDVDTLARAYGWREADILGMSAARRRCYLELVS